MNSVSNKSVQWCDTSDVSLERQIGLRNGFFIGFVDASNPAHFSLTGRLVRYHLFAQHLQH